MPRIPQWAKFVGVTILGVCGGAFGAGVAAHAAGQKVTDARRVADDADLGVKALSPRVGELERWRAQQDERWSHILRALDEIRLDVKDLKR